jgi:cytosine/adenosine deaminase-related metal-dependent hydrolase
MKILASDHVLPIAGPPIENGAVAIEGQAIVQVGTLKELTAAFPVVGIEHFGEAAILPGFVNCHSHLEVTAIRGALDSVEHDFSAWLLKLTAIRQGLSDEDIHLSALAGAVEGAAAGVTCFGDIGRFGAAGLQALKTAGLRGVLFQETEFCVNKSTAVEDVKNLLDRFDALRDLETELVTVGISPHSPYTVGPRQLELITDHALSNNVMLTIHASESSDEDELLQRGRGFFPELFKKFNIDWQSPLCTSIEYLSRLGVLSARPLLAHCVTVSARDIELIVQSGTRIAHCPKSNAKFGHGYAPLEAFLDAGVTVGLGSDSVASNNMCDLLEESRFAAFSARNRLPTKRFITAQEVLSAATIGGAAALGLDSLVGTLEAEKQADIAVISLSHIRQAPVADIHAALVFSSNSRDVIRTIVAGETVYSNSLSTRCDIDEIRRRVSAMNCSKDLRH